MHELAVCRGLISQVERIAVGECTRQVKRVTPRIGPLSGVEPVLRRDASPITAAGSLADQADLVVEEVPVTVECRRCGAHSQVAVNRLVCPDCGDFRGGDELLLKSVELEHARPGDAV